MLHKLTTTVAKTLHVFAFCTFQRGLQKWSARKKTFLMSNSRASGKTKHTGSIKGRMQTVHTATTASPLQEIICTRVRHVTRRAFVLCDEVFANRRNVSVCRKFQACAAEGRETWGPAHNVHRTCACLVQPALPFCAEPGLKM